jgi:hypothetical protein
MDTNRYNDGRGKNEYNETKETKLFGNVFQLRKFNKYYNIKSLPVLFMIISYILICSLLYPLLCASFALVGGRAVGVTDSLRWRY